MTLLPGARTLLGAHAQALPQKEAAAAVEAVPD